MFLKKQLGATLTHPRLVTGNPASRCSTPCQNQRRCYRLPPLKECRELFASKLGQPVDWGSEQWETEEWQQSDDWRDVMERAVKYRSGSLFG